MMQRFFYPFADLIVGNFFDLQGKGHVFKNVHMGPYSESLEHHTQSPPFRGNVKVLFFNGNGLPAQVDLPFG